MAGTVGPAMSSHLGLVSTWFYFIPAVLWVDFISGFVVLHANMQSCHSYFDRVTWTVFHGSCSALATIDREAVLVLASPALPAP